MVFSQTSGVCCINVDTKIFLVVDLFLLLQIIVFINNILLFTYSILSSLKQSRKADLYTQFVIFAEALGGKQITFEIASTF